MLSDHMFSPGKRIIGKWNHQSYLIERVLGAGTNGQVYLVRQGQKRYALKIGNDALDLQSEINALLELQQNKASDALFLLDFDDFHEQMKDFAFYVMKYVQGVHPRKFIHESGPDWYSVIGYRILARLIELHEQGYCFGDLKPDNILVSGYGTAELIDYGGLTPFGRAVRQYSERYDRGYWQAGSRVADVQYDLFAFAVTCIELADPTGNRLAVMEKTANRDIDSLCRLAQELPNSTALAPVLCACLRGQIRSAAEAQARWRQAVYAAAPEAVAGSSSAPGNRSPRPGKSRRRHHAPLRTPGLTVFLLLSLALFGFALYWTLQPI